ncbi:MAG: DNA polymerase III subunit beta, partial [Gammaproteobacteria bacterium]|nr:DNA polymerase III subunit beta [Gammaproteobacteria bacterium]
GSMLSFSVDSEKALVKSHKTRFRLTTLPAKDFPVIDTKTLLFSFNIPQNQLKRLIDKTSFAMAFQDVRYYLNGLLLEIGGKGIKAVATDGHRLAVANYEEVIDGAEDKSIIIPRKAILEISRLLEDTDDEVEISVGENFIRLSMDGLIFTSKLVDGQYPNYQSVIPKSSENIVLADKNLLKQCLIRTSILSNEKYRGIKLDINSDILKASANNPEQEEAEDEIPIDYQGERLEMGFNVNYLLDAISALDTDTVSLGINDSNGSTLVKAVENDECLYVVMPMRL